MNIAILQARTSSSRLPGKVLLPIEGKPMLIRQIERIKRSKLVDDLIVATSDRKEDDAIEALCLENGITCYRGSLDNVLERFYKIVIKYEPANIIRLTGDCPLIDPDIIDRVIDLHIRENNDYTSNTMPPTFPDGLDVEVISKEIFEKIYLLSNLPSHKEHVTLYIHKNITDFKVGNFRSEVDLSRLRWTVDEQEDYLLIQEIYKSLLPENTAFNTKDILNLLSYRPDLININNKYKRNEGLEKSLLNERKKILGRRCINMSRYEKSEEMLKKAMKSIPLGAQTFSKSITQLPHGVSPYFATHAEGAYLYDVDGNKYIDFINGLSSILLGYQDPDVNKAVSNQLAKGTIFSLSSPLEIDVAEKIIEMIPCAESVRFGKNGSDATAGAVRLARAYTNREYVAVCGYHGWQDWYIGSTNKDLGVPESVKDLTLKFEYNDLSSLENLFERYPNKIAAVIMEPMNIIFPENDFLNKVKLFAHDNNALLIFDETVTGFRFSNGGAQEYFGVIPDLATVGKGMANGFPLSAIVGKKEIMKLMDEVFFSFTFGGETLSLAAALATMRKLTDEPILKQINETGSKLINDLKSLIEKYNLGDVFSITGHPSWSFLNIKDTEKYNQFEIKTFYLQEMFKRNILILGSHNISYMHSIAEIDKLLAAYSEVFQLLSEYIHAETLLDHINGELLKPLFKVRG